MSIQNKKEDKTPIKQFRDKSNNWWLGYKHYKLLDGELIFCAGGIEDEEETKRMITYLKRKKLI